MPTALSITGKRGEENDPGRFSNRINPTARFYQPAHPSEPAAIQNGAAPLWPV